MTATAPSLLTSSGALKRQQQAQAGDHRHGGSAYALVGCCGPSSRGFAGEAGEPAYASLHRLLRTPPRLAVTGRPVHVCENPNLLAIAAGQLGPHCAPLVCTEGMPGAAQRTLLTQLAQAGARLLYHGDFDWPGIRIVMCSCGAAPWRFGAADYTAAAGTASGDALMGPAVAASWDAALPPAMTQRGLTIPEEGLAAALLLDLQE